MTTVLEREKTMTGGPALGFRSPAPTGAPPGGGSGGGPGGSGGGGGARFSGWSEFNDAPRMTSEEFQAQSETGKQIINGYKILALQEQCRAAKANWQAAKEKVQQAQNNVKYEQKLTQASQEKIKIGDQKIQTIKAKLEAARQQTRAAQAGARAATAKADAADAKADAAQNQASEERQKVLQAATSLRAATFAAQLGASHQARMEGIHLQGLRNFEGLTVPTTARRIA